MSLFQRFKLLFSVKASKALDRAEDPRETLDFAYKKAQEMLVDVKRDVINVAAARKRLDIQKGELETKRDVLGTQAMQALQAGDEALAREALTRKQALEQQLAALEQDRDRIAADERALIGTMKGLEQRVEEFGRRKETIKAQLTAADATARIGDSLTGVSRDLGNIGQTISNAEERILQSRARSGATAELVASGALDMPLGGAPRDDIALALEAVTSRSSIDAELAAMKGQLGMDTPAALEAGSGQGALPGEVIHTGDPDAQQR